jgi:hypothetical protein
VRAHDGGQDAESDKGRAGTAGMRQAGWCAAAAARALFAARALNVSRGPSVVCILCVRNLDRVLRSREGTELARRLGSSCFHQVHVLIRLLARVALAGRPTKAQY